MTSFPAALRAWAETLPDEMFAPLGWRDELLARLDVFATEWEKAHEKASEEADAKPNDARHGEAALSDGAESEPSSQRDGVGDQKPAPAVSRAEYLQIVAERDALKVELQELRDVILGNVEPEKRAAWEHRSVVSLAEAHKSDTDTMDEVGDAEFRDHLATLKAQLAAGDAARAALREALKLALDHVPESRSMRKQFIDVDEAAGSTYELVEQPWYSKCLALLASSPPERTT